MSKKLLAFVILCFIVTSVSIACAVSPAVATTVGGGLSAISSWLVTQAKNVSTTVMAWQYAWILFWFVMPFVGFIIGSLLVYRWHLPSRAKQTVFSKTSGTASLSGLQKEPAEPERQPATSTTTQKEEEPQAPTVET